MQDILTNLSTYGYFPALMAGLILAGEVVRDIALGDGK